MPHDAPAELDVEQVSTDLASDLISGLGGEPPAPGTSADAIDAVADPAADPEKTELVEGRTRGPDGKFTKADAAPAKVDPAAPAVDPAASSDLAAPKSWAKDMHPIWDKLAKGQPLTAEESKKAATYYNEREGQMAKGVEGYRTDAEFGRALKTVAAKHEEILKQQGLDAPRAFEYLLNAHRQLSTGTPEARLAYLHKVADTYGLKLAPAAPADPNAPVPAALPPEVKAALERLDKIEGTLTADQQQRYEAAKTQVANDVAAFADSKDEKGNAKHPYFDECADHICLLLKGDPGMKLETAYETAIWANPITRQKELTRLQQERETEARNKAKAAVEKAKKGTSTNVSGRDTQRAPQAPAASLANLDDVMKETHEEIKSRVD